MTTEAGKRLQVAVTQLTGEPDAIAAIEAEAARAALQSLRERVEALPWTVDQSYRASTDEVRLQASEVSRAAVIALIEEALEP
jgi:hypothetical protein